MNKSIVGSTAAAYVLLIHSVPTAADSGNWMSASGAAAIDQLMKDRGYQCLVCHDSDSRVEGPTWMEIAVNRRNHKWAHALIVYKISSGSVGEYGAAMPHNEVRDEDADTIADWILSLPDAVPKVVASPGILQP